MNFRQLFEHQAQRQKVIMTVNSNPINKGWGKLQYAINMLQMMMVECAEALQELPTKYWKLYDPSSIEREKVVEEWIDILLIWANFAFYFNITHEEFEKALYKKLNYNQKRKDHAANLGMTKQDKEAEQAYIDMFNSKQPGTMFHDFAKEYNQPFNPEIEGVSFDELNTAIKSISKEDLH